MSQQINLVGQTLGQYQIVELMGEGGMATVYKAWQPSLRRYVALKVLAPRLAGDAEFVKRFHQEAVSAANLKHAHIVTIHDVGVESGYFYIAMEFIEGRSLSERIRSGSAFTLEQVADVMAQIGSALDYAHQRGFIHRDIKSANILIEDSGRAVLTDFGIVKALSGSGMTSTLTQAGAIIGTPQYMSPEQVKDEPLDHRSDLYSLGIVCYEMLSGQVPFDGATTHAILYAQVNNPPPPLREFASLAVPPAVEAVLNRMLAKAREERYGSAQAFADDLAQAAGGTLPASMVGETVAVGQAGTPKGRAGRTPAETVGGVPTVKAGRPPGPPTPQPVPWQPAVTPAPPSAPARARRTRWPLVVGILAVVGLVLVVGAVAVMWALGINPLVDIQKGLELNDARAALEAGDYAGAVEGFDRVLELDPGDGEAIEGLLEAAANLAQAGQWDAAVAAYEKVERARPQEVRALQGLGRAYQERAEWEQAAGWYEKWTQVAPGDPNAFLALGTARFELEAHEGTVAAYEQAASLGASAAEMDVQLGLAYFELARYDQAAGPLQNAVAQNGEDFQLRRALGLSLFAQGQFEAAAEHLNEALALGAGRSDDELADLDYVLGDCHFEVQEYEQAIQFYEQAQALDPEGRSARAEGARVNLDEAYSRLAVGVMKSALFHLNFASVVTEGDETYAIARTEQRVRIEGPVRLVEGPWEGSQALVVEEGTTNEFIDPTLDGIGNWTAGGTTPPIVTEQSTEVPPYVGRYTAKVEFPAGCDAGFEGSRVSARAIQMLPGQTKTFSVWIMASDIAEISKLRAYATGSYGQGNNSANDLSHWVEKAGQWYRWHLTFTDDSDGPWTQYIAIYATQSLADKLTLYLDGVQYEEKGYPTTLCYGDGGNGYRWKGDSIPHTSISERLVTLCGSDAAGSLDYSSDHTVLVWMKLLDQAGEGLAYPAVFHYGQYYTNNSIALMFYRDDGPLQLYAKDNAGVWHERNSMYNPAQHTDSYEADVWYMLGYRYDQSENRVDLIWDGQIDEQGAGTAWPSADNTCHELGIGCRPDASDNMSDGVVARVMVFSRALTAAELTALYSSDDIQ